MTIPGLGFALTKITPWRNCMVPTLGLFNSLCNGIHWIWRLSERDGHITLPGRPCPAQSPRASAHLAIPFALYGVYHISCKLQREIGGLSFSVVCIIGIYMHGAC